MSEDILRQYDVLIRNPDALAAMLTERNSLSAFLFLTDRMADEVEALRDRVAELEARPWAARSAPIRPGAPRDVLHSRS